MPFVKVWIHLVWSTKNREPYLDKSIRQHVFAHIRENAVKKDIYIDFINGYSDHVHSSCCKVYCRRHLIAKGKIYTIKEEPLCMMAEK